MFGRTTLLPCALPSHHHLPLSSCSVNSTSTHCLEHFFKSSSPLHSREPQAFKPSTIKNQNSIASTAFQSPPKKLHCIQNPHLQSQTSEISNTLPKIKTPKSEIRTHTHKFTKLRNSCTRCMYTVWFWPNTPPYTQNQFNSSNCNWQSEQKFKFVFDSQIPNKNWLTPSNWFLNHEGKGVEEELKIRSWRWRKIEVSWLPGIAADHGVRLGCHCATAGWGDLSPLSFLSVAEPSLPFSDPAVVTLAAAVELGCNPLSRCSLLPSVRPGFWTSNLILEDTTFSWTTITVQYFFLGDRTAWVCLCSRIGT